MWAVNVKVQPFSNSSIPPGKRNENGPTLLIGPRSTVAIRYEAHVGTERAAPPWCRPSAGGNDRPTERATGIGPAPPAWKDCPGCSRAS
jgi:hypothetical protein